MFAFADSADDGEGGRNGGQVSEKYGTSHKWTGRIFLGLGAIYEGLGLNLSYEDKIPIIAYSVLAAFFSQLWALMGLWSKRRNAAAGKKRKGKGWFMPSQGDSYAMHSNADRQYA